MMSNTAPATFHYMASDVEVEWPYSGQARAAKTVVSGIFGVSAERMTFEVAIRSVQEITMQAFNEFAQMIETIPTIEAVHGQAAGTYLHLITYANQSLEKERYQVYDAELQIAARHPNLDFEFDLIDRRGYPATWVETAVGYVKVFRELPNTEDEHDVVED